MTGKFYLRRSCRAALLVSLKLHQLAKRGRVSVSCYHPEKLAMEEDAYHGEVIVELMKAFPCLWDITSGNSRDRNHKEQA